MRSTLLAAVFLYSLSFADYTTPNTGINWTLDSLVAYSGGSLTGSFPNYAQNDLITISAADRVVIPPGSIISVTAGSGKGFTVFGTLSAIGTLTDSIIVKGTTDSAGWYRGFRIEDSAVDSLCVFAYCRIMNAAEGVHCLNASPTIRNSLFTKNSSNGVRTFTASPTIRNCVFTFNRQSAITVNVSSSPLIENNIFSYNNYLNTGARNAIAVGGQGTNNPIIRGNEIFNQNYYRAGAIGLSTLTSSDVCNPLIENNYLHDNSFGVATTAFSVGGTIQPMIRYNRIENNRINPDPMVSGSGITMQAGGPSNAPIITGNHIKGNYW
ncbi:MAG: right-handed parallel beta-helix repeat-containing protein, partial [Ignavibacteriae bacterium]|nr:right-handed parallel beta-helix repeat-containing protein [Ignavibacteriota bacterium]